MNVFKNPQSSENTFKMEPRVLASLDQLSEKTLRIMDKTIKNYGDGAVSDPVDVKEMKRLADALPD